MLPEVLIRAVLAELERAGVAFVDLAEETVVGSGWVGTGLEVMGSLMVVEGVGGAGHCSCLEVSFETS